MRLCNAEEGGDIPVVAVAGAGRGTFEECGLDFIRNRPRQNGRASYFFCAARLALLVGVCFSCAAQHRHRCQPKKFKELELHTIHPLGGSRLPTFQFITGICFFFLKSQLKSPWALGSSWQPCGSGVQRLLSVKIPQTSFPFISWDVRASKL